MEVNLFKVIQQYTSIINALICFLQIDYLQQKNADLQRQMDRTLTQARVVENKSLDTAVKNTELERSLHDVDSMARALQTEKDVALLTADREISEAKVELEKSRTELETMDMQVIRLKAVSSFFCQFQQTAFIFHTLDSIKLSELGSLCSPNFCDWNQRSYCLT